MRHEMQRKITIRQQHTEKMMQIGSDHGLCDDQPIKSETDDCSLTSNEADHQNCIDIEADRMDDDELTESELDELQASDHGVNDQSAVKIENGRDLVPEDELQNCIKIEEDHAESDDELMGSEIDEPKLPISTLPSTWVYEPGINLKCDECDMSFRVCVADF